MGASSFRAHSNLGMNGDNPAISRGIVHQKIHEGEVFMASWYDGTVTASANMDTLITVPASTLAHMRAFCGATGATELIIYESTTASSAGSTVTALNTNRNSSKTAGVTVTKNPTLTNTGTAVFLTVNPGGYGVMAGDLPFGGGEVVLPAGKYLVRQTNITASAIKASTAIQWYETGTGTGTG